MIGAMPLLIKMGARQIVISGQTVSPADAAPGVAARGLVSSCLA
jgi:hypothetical protein